MRHSVTSSPWRGGQGDLLLEFTDACRAEGLRAGLYLSPWDRNAASYGDSPRYNDFYCDQLSELLTRYGPIHEVGFDGANGEGPNGRRQSYDWERYRELVRRLQPDAVIFSDAGPDIRWIGNETGVAGETNSSTVDPSVVPYPGATGERVMNMLRHGDPAGTVWRPGETDVSIRPGWFYHPTDGLLQPADVASLGGMRERLDVVFGRDLTSDLDAGRRATVSVADLRENISKGQAVARYTLEGLVGSSWRILSRGATIGYRKLDRFDPVTVSAVQVRVEEAIGTTGPIEIGSYLDSGSSPARGTSE